PGVSVVDAEVRAGNITTRGPLLITHWGLSGPAILKASAWGAREFSEIDYQLELRVNWTGTKNAEDLNHIFSTQREAHGVRKVIKRSVIDGITKRLWQKLCEAAGIKEETTWANLPKEQLRKLSPVGSREARCPPTGKFAPPLRVLRSLRC
ncbi:NAD(P)/FAD-dependent oxidoreductase, partial [Akkermansiaceae bacterium]|nr:NAD(P)/FAD-dependent oxidoreductase [Akkermansiaceae bacterium]